MRSDRHVGTRSRGQGALAVFVLAVVIGGGFALQDGLGLRVPKADASGIARSGAWFCPHGGGSKSWRATLYLANPGADPVTARVTSLVAKKPSTIQGVAVPAQTTVAVAVPAVGREASTYVEYFGGWLAAGWVAQGGGGEIGVGAEPCAPSAARTWYAPDGTTEQGQDAYLVVMNPFAVDAVFSVVLLTPRRAPIRNAKLADRVLPPGRSVAFRLNAFAEGDPAVGAEVDVSLGRVAVSSLGISRDGGIRSVIGSTEVTPRVDLPVGAGAGQSTLVVMNPGDAPTTFRANLISGRAPVPAGGLTDSSQNPTSADVYPVTTSGDSSIDVTAQDSAGFAATLRSIGVGNDDAATGGTASPASDWVVVPAIAGEPAHPGLIIVNPSDAAVTVTLHALQPQGATSPPDITITIEAGSVVQTPSGYLAQVHQAAIEVRSVGGDVVAMAASTSLGVKGLSTYALAMGVAVPAP
jgi:hypothetical protein